MEAVYARFGRELQRLRRQKKLSQAALAELVDPSGERFRRGTVAMIETGRQRVALHTFLELARALDVPADELLPVEASQVPELASRLGDLSAPEQDWVNRIFAHDASARPAETNGSRS